MKKLICLLLLILTALAGCNTATVELPSNLPTLDFSFVSPDASPTLPPASDAPSASASAAIPQGSAVTLTQKYTYETMMNDLTALKARFGELIHYDSSYTLGKTSFGRELPYFILGNPNAERKILLHAAIHAREYISAQVLLRSVEMCCEQYQTLSYQGHRLSDMLQRVAVYVVPMINPDGVNLVNLGIQSVPAEHKEKVLAINNNRADFSKWKANGLGVDLNSNWGAASSEHKDKYPSPAPDGYAGSAFSEPETKALQALCEAQKFDSCTAYHTQGKIIYWYYGQTGALKTEHLALAKELCTLTGYSPVDPRPNESYGRSEVVGQKDWFIYRYNKPAFTIELGRGSHPLPISQIEEILQAVWQAPVCLICDAYCDALAAAA